MKALKQYLRERSALSVAEMVSPVCAPYASNRYCGWKRPKHGIALPTSHVPPLILLIFSSFLSLGE